MKPFLRHGDILFRNTKIAVNMKFVLVLAKNTSYCSYYSKSCVLLFISVWSGAQSGLSFFPRGYTTVVLQEMGSPQHFSVIVYSSSIVVSVQAVFVILGKIFNVRYDCLLLTFQEHFYLFYSPFMLYIPLFYSCPLPLYNLHVHLTLPREESIEYLLYKSYTGSLNEIKYLT